MSEPTITEMSMERIEKNKGKKLVRNLAGKEYTLFGIQWEEEKLMTYMGISEDIAEFETMSFRGYLFFCQICERWRGMKSLDINKYPKHIVCVDCIDHITHEEMERQIEAEEKRIVDGVDKEFYK